MTTFFAHHYENHPKQKFAGPLVGASFMGAPVRPNMRNMPKSASVCIAYCLLSIMFASWIKILITITVIMLP